MARELPTRSTGQTIDASHMNDVQVRSVQRYASAASFPTAGGDGLQPGELAYAEDVDQLYITRDAVTWELFRVGDPTLDQALDTGPYTITTTNTLRALSGTTFDDTRPRMVVARGMVLMSATNYGRVQVQLARIYGGSPTVLEQTEVALQWAIGGTAKLPWSINWLDNVSPGPNPISYAIYLQGLSLVGNPTSYDLVQTVYEL